MATDPADVEIPHGDSTVTLKCTLGAAKRINALYGNFVHATQRLMQFDLDAYAAIVAAALEKKVAEVEAEVYAAGMENLAKPLGKFLAHLSNGGKPLPVSAPEGAKTGEG